jgi:hypothetical protein
MPNEFPPGRLFGFKSPHSLRMRNWARSFPLKAEPDDPILKAHQERRAEMHIGMLLG